MPKYHSANLAPMFRLAAQLCLQMRAASFTDNGGAIHSAERIMNIWGLHLNYPGLSHINNLRQYEGAEFSTKARSAHGRNEKVFIEHVAPLRALTRGAIEKIENGESDEAIERYVRGNFHLVLLTADETKALNKQNRSRIDAKRLAKANIAPWSGTVNLITATIEKT